MKFLVDQNRSPRLAQLLRAQQVTTQSTPSNADSSTQTMTYPSTWHATNKGSSSGHTDFGTLLALARRTSPSVILFPSRHHRTAEQQVAVILEHLDDLADDLTTSAVAVITDQRIRVRRLHNSTTNDRPERTRRT